MTREQMIDLAVRRVFARYASCMVGDVYRRFNGGYPVLFDQERVDEIRAVFRRIATGG